MTNERKVEYLLDIPFKEFMPGQLIKSVEFNDDMKDIEDKVNELIGEHNRLDDEVINHNTDKLNPHETTAHQVGTYTSEEIDGFVADLKNGEFNDNAIINRVLADDCVETRNIKDGNITVSKVDSSFGSQLNISQNIEIVGRYTKVETDELIRSKVGEGTYSKEELDQKFQEVQAGVIVDGTITPDKVTSDFGDKVDISNNPSILNKYTKNEVDILIKQNGLPKDWGNLREITEDVDMKGSLPVADYMIAEQFTSPVTSVIDVDVKEVVDARKGNASVGNRLDGIDSQIKDIEYLENSVEVNVMFPPKSWKIDGLVGNNDVEDSVRLNTIINKIKELNIKATLRFPNGNFLLNSSINIPTNVNIVGNGRNETIIKKGDFLGNLFNINKSGVSTSTLFYNFSISDMTLVSDNSYSEGGALFIENCPRPIIKNVHIQNFNGNGITFFGVCFYAHLDSVFIHYCSNNPNGYYLITDTLPSIESSGFSGNNLRCALIDFTADGFDSRNGDWGRATADLTTINCNFEANDVGVRWKSSDCHFISSVFQGNAMYDFISEGSTNFSECHLETDTIGMKKTSQYCLLQKTGSVHMNNCNMWGNGVENSIAGIKIEDGYYLNINGGRNLGFKYGVDSDKLLRLYSVGNDFVSKDNSNYLNGYITKHFVVNSSVGGVEVNTQLILKDTVSGDIIPTNNNGMNIGASDRKTNNIHNTFLFSEKVFLSNQVTMFYNATAPNGVVSASKGSLCLTPLGLYVREGGNYTDTIWVKK